MIDNASNCIRDELINGLKTPLKDAMNRKSVSEEWSLQYQHNDIVYDIIMTCQSSNWRIWRATGLAEFYHFIVICIFSERYFSWIKRLHRKDARPYLFDKKLVNYE